MNERIQELRTQAAAWVVANHQPADPKNYTQPEIDQRYLMYEQKFAELIVSECADLFEVEYGKSEISGYQVATVLKEHFGVER